jgi:hypothetical protein
MAVRDVVQAAAGVGGGNEYVEDVFSTYLYNGTQTAKTITNGIDLAGEGGMVWSKVRNNSGTHRLNDSVRGVSNGLRSDDTAADQTVSNGITAFNGDGYTLGTDAGNSGYNFNNYTYASWTFRKAPKFFDVVTWTGNNVSGRQIPHNLGSVPGCIIVKNILEVSNWEVWHRGVVGVTETATARLNSTAGFNENNNYFSDNNTSSDIVLGGLSLNELNKQYIAYVFAHDAGGFGDDGEQNVISCGSFTTDGSGNATVNLGYEPQWVLVKNTGAVEDWILVDDMRGWVVGGNSQYLRPNLPNSESGTALGSPTATGFTFSFSASATYIYIAIRRPMKTPESGTEVFAPVARTGTGANATITSNFVTDLIISRGRTHASYQINAVTDRLRGPLKYLITNNANSLDPTQAEATGTNTITSFAKMTGVDVGSDAVGFCNINTIAYINWMFRRAPGFFDVVAYTGTGSARTVSHNLGVAPELMIIKNRNSGFYGWSVYHSATGNTNRLEIDSNAGASGVSSWNSTNPTENVFTLGDENGVNRSEYTYIAYLFATLPGISKVGSYTGNGTSQTIDCGFSAGARFVLTKRYDGGGYWNIWDSERGIVAGNDPRLGLNRNTVEDTGHDYIDPDNSGFIVNYVADNFEDSNVNGNEYLFLAIA